MECLSYELVKVDDVPVNVSRLGCLEILVPFYDYDDFPEWNAILTQQYFVIKTLNYTYFTQ